MEQTSIAIINHAFKRHLEAFDKLNTEQYKACIAQAADLLVQTANTDNTVMICGNGGSASDAEHLAGEWVGRYKKDRRPLSAIALASDTASLTAIANDYGYEHIFSRQIEAHAKKDDVLVAISTSGASANILKAIETAKTNGMKTILLTGTNGECHTTSVDCCIAVPSIETARIQEMHELIYHIWGEYVDANIT